MAEVRELPDSFDAPGIRNPDDFIRAAGAPEYTDRLDDHGDLEDLLGETDRRGILDVPAESREAALAGDANLVREGVIAERLWLLGYLKKKTWVASSDERRHRNAFFEAVAIFQHDAGLRIDQWSGEKTWQALQQLVTFESATHVERYCDDGVPRVALNRALRLRLWALGILRNGPKKGPEDDRVPTRALAKFWSMWRQFADTRLPETQPPLQDLIDRVFDQDALLDNIVKLHGIRAGDPDGGMIFRRRRLDDRDPEAANRDAADFLVGVAKIELWMLGFDVDISDRRDFPVFGVNEASAGRHETLADAVEEFWTRLAGESDDRLREHVTPELFIALQDPAALPQISATAMPATDERPEAGDYSREVANKLDTDDSVRATWSAGKRLGMKLWDGMRRLWRWIKRGIRALLEIGRNVVRAFFRYSMKAFEIAKRAVGTVYRASTQYLDGALLDEPSIKLTLYKDGDMVAFLQDANRYADFRYATDSLNLFGAAFQFSCRILALIVRALRAAVTGAIGWARLLWVLVDCYRDIRPVYKELKALPVPVRPE